jgi:hypothetical protein
MVIRPKKDFSRIHPTMEPRSLSARHQMGFSLSPAVGETATSSPSDAVFKVAVPLVVPLVVDDRQQRVQQEHEPAAETILMNNAYNEASSMSPSPSPSKERPLERRLNYARQ